MLTTGWTDVRTDGRTNGRKTGPLHRAMPKAGATKKLHLIKIPHVYSLNAPKGHTELLSPQHVRAMCVICRPSKIENNCSEVL